MFNSFPMPNQEDDHFANINYSKNVECILPTAELMVNFRSNGLKAQKACFVYAEKLDFKGLIQLRLTEKCDQRKMYITTVDSTSFQELKQDQSLHVTFAGFIENLVHILQDCQAGKLEICLVQLQQDTRGIGLSDTVLSAGQMNCNYQLQFVEMRPFKNLIHLCLPCRMAPLNVVLFYMNNILDVLQKKCLNHEQTSQQLQHEIHNHIRRIDQLDAECLKLRENLMESTRSINQKHAEELMQLQESLRKTGEQRQQDSERNRKTINALQQQIDKLVSEKSAIQSEKVQELKRNETLNEELAASKARISNLKEQNEKLHLEISALKNLERKHEMHLQDSRKEITELKEKLKKYDKNKAELVAELEAEKKISQTKRQALEMATEEISKANQIIMKQNQELNKMKKTIGWRTEVALQQEQAIKQKDLALKDREEELVFLRATVESLRREIPRELDSMRKFANSLETKYTEQINSLKMKLQPLDKENIRPSKDISRTARR
ncbi:spindle assembly abnormal protein 6 homolog [Lucilia sericata]|uniref:spindle assembly abnormal protein 6 homolog n=1 Tax=Lucilia sericata TaxID=13632 RepID=UPI0018A8474D|nr:spindle assembly abnormal protein 6 homolog [Lucilia sericata]